MPFHPKPLHEQVIVITGASSGIGLATARAAARRGARLVLTSRNDEVLGDVERQINVAGGRAIHVAADVTKRDQLQHVADAAIAEFGGFDTWINDAGLGIWCRIEEVTEEDSRRLFETNFWGIVNGTLVALPYLKQRGGTLINLGSIVSDLAVPLQGMYSASKHAIQGFTNALRMELMNEGAPVNLTLIKPSAIDTPFPNHARNYTGRAAKLPPPVYAPEEVAKAILYAATHWQRDIVIGGGGKLMTSIAKRAPRLADWIGAHVLIKQHNKPEPARDPQGALFEAGVDGNVRGDYPGHVMKTSLYTRAALHPVLAGALVAAAGVATAAAVIGVKRTPLVAGAKRLANLK